MTTIGTFREPVRGGGGASQPAVARSDADAGIDTCLRLALPRSNALIKLLLSDSCVPGKDAIWLGTLMRLLEPFGLQERALRSSVFRLEQQGWLVARRHGRRSSYRLAPALGEQLRAEWQTLSTPPSRTLDGNWTLLVNTGGHMGAVRYAALRHTLLDQGYYALAPNLMARPAPERADDLPPLSAPSGIHPLAMFEVSGQQIAAAHRESVLSPSGWDLAAPEALYRRFLLHFEPFRRALSSAAGLSDRQAFVVRLLVSHGYRNCRSGDPLLPTEFLPASWPGMAAYELAMELYRATCKQACRHVLETLRTDGWPDDAKPALNAITLQGIQI